MRAESSVIDQIERKYIRTTFHQNHNHMTHRIILPIAVTALLTACATCPDPGIHDNTAKEAANKAAFENIAKAWDTGDEKLMADNLADNFVNHNPDPNIPGAGKEQWITAMKTYRASSPDMKAEGKVMMADGDWVAGVAMIRGTNTGDMGPGMPATGKAWEASGIDVIRFENGKAVEAWSGFDSMKMMSDLGLMGGDHDMTAEKEHVCNPGCKPPDHAYLHGEKGHVCSPECPAMKEMEAKKR